MNDFGSSSFIYITDDSTAEPNLDCDEEGSFCYETIANVSVILSLSMKGFVEMC